MSLKTPTTWPALLMPQHHSDGQWNSYVDSDRYRLGGEHRNPATVTAAILGINTAVAAQNLLLI
jgi:hypothetical protein